MEFLEFFLIGEVSTSKIIAFIIGLLFSGCVGAIGGIETSKSEKLGRVTLLWALGAMVFFLLLNYPLSIKY